MENERKKKGKRMTEAELQMAVADYLRLQYPNVLFHSDFGSGVKLTPAQAIRQKRQNGGRRAWPDMFIAAPSANWENEVYNGDGKWVAMPYFGLFLELKREGTRIHKKDGTFATEHIMEQALVLDELLEAGYDARFAVGFDEAKKIIDEYLGGTGK